MNILFCIGWNGEGKYAPQGEALVQHQFRMSKTWHAIASTANQETADTFRDMSDIGSFQMDDETWKKCVNDWAAFYKKVEGKSDQALASKLIDEGGQRDILTYKNREGQVKRIEQNTNHFITALKQTMRKHFPRSKAKNTSSTLSDAEAFMSDIFLLRDIMYVSLSSTWKDSLFYGAIQDLLNGDLFFNLRPTSLGDKNPLSGPMGDGWYIARRRIRDAIKNDIGVSVYKSPPKQPAGGKVYKISDDCYLVVKDKSDNEKRLNTLIKAYLKGQSSPTESAYELLQCVIDLLDPQKHATIVAQLSTIGTCLINGDQPPGELHRLLILFAPMFLLHNHILSHGFVALLSSCARAGTSSSTISLPAAASLSSTSFPPPASLSSTSTWVLSSSLSTTFARREPRCCRIWSTPIISEQRDSST